MKEYTVGGIFMSVWKEYLENEAKWRDLTKEERAIRDLIALVEGKKVGE